MMSDQTEGDDQARHFLSLYAQIVQAPLDPAEFDSDDLYAFQAFERAKLSDHDGLRNLAQAVRDNRRKRMANAMSASPNLGDTYKLNTVAPAQFAPPPAAEAKPENFFESMMAAAAEAAITGKHQTLSDPQAAAAFAAADTPPPKPGPIVYDTSDEKTIVAAAEAAITGVFPTLGSTAPDVTITHQTTYETTDDTTLVTAAAAAMADVHPSPREGAVAAPAPAARSAPAPQPAGQAERRSGASRLAPADVAQLMDLKRLYGQQFSEPLDVAEFIVNDEYGRFVIDESVASPNEVLADLARNFLDGEGRHRMHRRGWRRKPSSGAAHANNRIKTLACDGTTQTLGDFRGIGTYCLISNAKFSQPVAVAVKGIKQALLAPGYAIACRTAMVRVKGPPGAVVEVEFVGLPELALSE